MIEEFENDHCSLRGADKLAVRIRDYWRARGGEVDVKLEHATYLSSMRSVRADIRSNMINGYPPKKIGAVR